MNELLIPEANTHISLCKMRMNSFRNIKPNLEILNTEELNKSIELLARLEYRTKEKGKYSEKKCEFCQLLFPIRDNKPFTCRSCGLVLCRNHRMNKDHYCIKKANAIERYLQAKKVISCKLKANKTIKR